MSGKFQTINRDTPYIITAIHNVEIAINALFVFIHSLVAGRFERVTCYAPYASFNVSTGSTNEQYSANWPRRPTGTSAPLL
jgi:hypothetical protein